MIHSLAVFDTVSLSDFKRSPLSAMEEADGIVAVLSQNRPVFYCITPSVMNMFTELFGRPQTDSKSIDPPSNEVD